MHILVITPPGKYGEFRGNLGVACEVTSPYTLPGKYVVFIEFVYPRCQRISSGGGGRKRFPCNRYTVFRLIM